MIKPEFIHERNLQWRFQIYFISLIMPYFNGYTALSLGINHELVLKQFSMTPAGMITDLSIPLGWLSQQGTGSILFQFVLLSVRIKMKSVICLNWSPISLGDYFLRVTKVFHSIGKKTQKLEWDIVHSLSANIIAILIP